VVRWEYAIPEEVAGHQTTTRVTQGHSDSSPAKGSPRRLIVS
jgi:hypothetical protein